MKRLDPLTSIRFIAAIIVVLVHAGHSLMAYLPEWADSVIAHGYVGVNLFFILSGFILTYNYMDRFGAGSVSTREFLVARFARLYPIFFVALLATAPKFFLEPPQPDIPSFPALAASHLTMTHAWLPTHGNSWIGPSWSIGTEFFFYLAFPLLVLPIARLGSRAVWILLAVTWAVSLVLPWLYSVGTFNEWNFGWLGGDLSANRVASRIIRWWPLFRLPEFIIGALICRLYLDKKLSPTWLNVKVLSLLAAISTVAIFVMVGSGDAIRPMLVNQAMLTLPFGVILWFLAYGQGWVAAILSWKPLVLLGEASYSLYMLHIGVLHVGFKLSERFFGLGRESAVATLAMIAMTVLASVVAYKLIEVPSRKWIVRKYGSRVKQEATA